MSTKKFALFRTRSLPFLSIALNRNFHVELLFAKRSWSRSYQTLNFLSSLSYFSGFSRSLALIGFS